MPFFGVAKAVVVTESVRTADTTVFLATSPLRIVTENGTPTAGAAGTAGGADDGAAAVWAAGSAAAGADASADAAVEAIGLALATGLLPPEQEREADRTAQPCSVPRLSWRLRAHRRRSRLVRRGDSIRSCNFAIRHSVQEKHT